MRHDEIQTWLDRYIEAWASNEEKAIGRLFTDDAVYSYRPWESDEHTVRGRDAIVEAWHDQEVDPAIWEAHYEPYVAEGKRAVAIGWTRYQPVGGHSERLFHNAFLLEFNGDGRCSSFHEFWIIREQ